MQFTAGGRGEVGIVGGTGKLGAALAARLASAGRPVLIGSRDPVRAEQAAARVRERVGSENVRGGSNEDAARAGGVVVLTVPYDSVAATLPAIAEAIGDRVVVSTAVPIGFVPGAAPTAISVAEGSACEQAASLLPAARVVGALHSVSHVTLGHLDQPIDADIVLTGDDADAKQVTAELLALLAGARIVDGGPLANSRYVEQFTVLLLSINARHRAHAGVRIANLPDQAALAGGALSG